MQIFYNIVTNVTNNPVASFATTILI